MSAVGGCFADFIHAFRDKDKRLKDPVDRAEFTARVMADMSNRDYRLSFDSYQLAIVRRLILESLLLGASPELHCEH